MAVKPITDQKVIDNIRQNYREKIEGKTVLESKPLFCVLSINSRCNLRCAHCPSSSKPYARIGADAEINMKVFPVLERELFPHLYGLMFSGTLGEPTIAKNFKEILRIALKYDFFLELATHGHNLRGEKLDLLVEKSARVRLSFEGVNPKTYEAVRGVPLAHLLSNLDRVVELKRKRNSHLEFIFNFTAWYNNIREFPDFVDLAARYGCDKVALHHMNPESERMRYHSLIYHQSLFNDMMDKAREKADRHGIELFGVDKFPQPGSDGVCYANLNQSPREIEEFKTRQYRMVLAEKLGREATAEDLVNHRRAIKCQFPWEMVAIVENGNMRPCCWTSRDFGNVIRDGFEKVWNGSTYQKLRASINTPKPPIYCRNCTYLATDVKTQLDARLSQIDGERVSSLPLRRFLYIKAHTSIRNFFKKEKVTKSRIGKAVIKTLKTIKHRFFGVDLR